MAMGRECFGRTWILPEKLSESFQSWMIIIVISELRQIGYSKVVDTWLIHIDWCWSSLVDWLNGQKAASPQWLMVDGCSSLQDFHLWKTSSCAGEAAMTELHLGPRGPRWWGTGPETHGVARPRFRGSSNAATGKFSWEVPSNLEAGNGIIFRCSLQLESMMPNVLVHDD